jgi:hypothetical protein
MALKIIEKVYITELLEKFSQLCSKLLQTPLQLHCPPYSWGLNRGGCWELFGKLELLELG